MGKNKGFIYVTLSLLALSLGGDVFFYAAKRNIAHKNIRLEAENVKLAESNKDIAANKDRLNEDKASLESALSALKKDIDELKGQLESEKASGLQAASDMSEKENEILRLKGEIDKYAGYNKDLEDRLSSLSSAYRDLDTRFAGVSRQKRKSEKRLFGFLDRFSREESVTSLGTVVVSK